MSERKTEISKLPSADPALLNKLAWSARWSDVARSREYAQQALRDAGEGQGKRSDAQRGFALRTLSWQARWSGSFEAALKDGLQAERFLPEQRYPNLRAMMYANIAVIHLTRGRFDLAWSSVERAEMLLRDDCDADILVDVLCAKAIVQVFCNDKARAGLSLGRAGRHATGAAIALVELIVTRWLIEDKEFDRARDHVEKAILAAKEHDNKLLLPYCYEVRMLVDIRLGDLHDIDQTMSAAKTMANDLDSPRALTHLQFVEGRYLETTGQCDAALETFKAGAKIAASLGYSMYQQRYALELADLYERLGRLPQALEQHKTAWRLQREMRM